MWSALVGVYHSVNWKNARWNVKKKLQCVCVCVCGSVFLHVAMGMLWSLKVGWSN